MKSRKVVLTNLLKVLVDEWGPDEVLRALDKVISAASKSRRSREATGYQSEKVVRPSAEELVTGLEIDADRKRSLSLLAARFDNKDFLPSIADVREFIIMAGDRPPTMKGRQDSFRHLLRVLLRVPPERLQQIAEAATHAGPAQLGPISDAISAAGERIPRRNHDPDPDPR